MTKNELIEILKKDYYKKRYTDVFVAAYNLALEHAGEKAESDPRGEINQVEILALQIDA